MHDTRQLCTFRLERLHFGVDVVQVQEVLRHQEMTRVPLSSPLVRGLINLRGQIVTALDLRPRFDFAARDPDLLPMNVVLRSDNGAVSLLVDEIGEVVVVDPAAFEPAPETISRAGRELIAGVYKLEGRLLLLLDTERALHIDGAHETLSPRTEEFSRGMPHVC